MTSAVGHRLPSAVWHLEAKQDRVLPVRARHRQLKWQAADQPSGDRADDREHHRDIGPTVHWALDPSLFPASLIISVRIMVGIHLIRPNFLGE